MSQRYDARSYYFTGAVEDYDERFLECRDVGHSWIPNPHWDVTEKGGRVIEYRRTCLCARCDCQKTQFFDGTMHPSRQTYYKHSDGFIVGREVTIDRATARFEQIRRYGLNGERRRRKPLGALRAV